MSSEPPKMFLEAFERTGTLVTGFNRARVTAMAVSKASTDASKAIGLDFAAEVVPPQLNDEWIRMFMQGLKPYLEAQMKKLGQ